MWVLSTPFPRVFGRYQSLEQRKDNLNVIEIVIWVLAGLIPAIGLIFSEGLKPQRTAGERLLVFGFAFVWVYLSSPLVGLIDITSHA
jgi:hypothetical protein